MTSFFELSDRAPRSALHLVLQTTDFVVNLQAAKTLGLTGLAVCSPPLHRVIRATSGTKQTWRDVRPESVMRSILLQKSKVASVRIFGETLKHEVIDNSANLSRATEVAYEFCVRR